MSFQFSLQSVLKVRQSERNELRQAVSLLERDHAAAVQASESLHATRDKVLEELRNLNDAEALSPEQIATRQRYCEQLGRELLQLQATIRLAKRKWDLGLKELIAVDQSVKSLERLAERQRSEYLRSSLKAERLEFDDSLRSHRRVA
ncbi:flagellar export protein FliJ [Schlesneria sp.]|uniref:flagellar export protein FliJ n=1 Tax=Schlesneria sp. TaxID=2762018 RepID=UPI002F1349A3